MSDDTRVARTVACEPCGKKTLHWQMDGRIVCESCGHTRPAETDEVDPDARSEQLARIQRELAAANMATATAVKRIAGRTDDPSADIRLRPTHAQLIDAYREIDTALSTVEQVIDTFEDPPKETPRRVLDEHADRIRDEYDGPVCFLGLELLSHNRREWMWKKDGTVGHDDVRRHGLTENQRSWLNDLQDAWRAYDGGDSDE